jgi:tRNA 2-selenouridine synthase
MLYLYLPVLLKRICNGKAMMQRITISDLMKQRDGIVLLDVRTPAEFTHGHIPGAFNVPLFTNEERVQVGTTYKQVGREAAILLGFDLTGSKWSGFVRDVIENAPQKKVAVHCWRGGMRSGAMAWALDLYGFEVFVVEGGYKHYRNWVLRQLGRGRELRVVGGMTGSGKTRTLQVLQGVGEQVIDLEELAQHRGSTYGTLNRMVQPSQEQFENDLVDKLITMDHQQTIWVEDESVTIGRRLIPKPFWNQMQAALVFNLEVPLDRRVQALAREYGTLDKDFLIACTERIHKRLGSEQTKHAITAIREDKMEEFVRRVLVYYDKTYQKGLDLREGHSVVAVPVGDTDPSKNAAHLLHYAKTHSTLHSLKTLPNE